MIRRRRSRGASFLGDRAESEGTDGWRYQGTFCSTPPIWSSMLLRQRLGSHRQGSKRHRVNATIAKATVGCHLRCLGVQAPPGECNYCQGCRRGAQCVPRPGVQTAE